MKKNTAKILLSNPGILLFLALLTAISPHAVSDEGNGDTLELSFDIWQTVGRTIWSHDASQYDSGLGNPTSVLEYDELMSNIFELGLKYRLTKKEHLDFSVAVGEITDGSLYDSDYFSAEGAQVNNTSTTGAHRFSFTDSTVDRGDVFSLGFNYGRRVTSAQSPFGFGYMLGVHYWEETYKARDILYLECTLPACPPEGTFKSIPLVITNTVRWFSVFAGVDAKLRLGKKAHFAVAVKYSPIARLDNEDTHHLRGDLDQPSLTMSGDGTQLDLDAELIYCFNQYACLALGYRYWHRELRDGTVTIHGSDGGASSFPLNQFETTRHGGTLTYRVVF